MDAISRHVSRGLCLTVLLCGLELSAQEPLSLEETLNRVVEANLRIEAGMLDREIAEQRAQSEWAIFEPVFLASIAQEANNRQNTTEQFLSQRVSVFDEQNTVYSAAIEGNLPTGGTLRVGMQARGLDNNLQVLGGKEWETFSGVTLTQPLLRDKGWKTIAAQIRLAAEDSDIAVQEYRSQLALVLSEAEDAYWLLSAANAFVALRTGSVEIAEKMLASNRERLEAGRTNELEVLQSEAGLAMRRAQLSEAEITRDEASNMLEFFLGREAEDSSRILPTDEVSVEVVLPDLDEVAGMALRSHPAYVAQKARCEQALIRLAYAKNQRLPSLDLKASYGLNGLSDEFEESFDVASQGDHPSWYVGVEFRYPIFGSKRERHRAAAAKMEQRRALLELKAIELELLNHVRSRHKRVAAQQDRVRALDEVVALHRRLLENEQSRLEVGRGESRQVLEAEEDLSAALIEALNARLDLRHALVELYVNQGSYLSERGFEFMDTGDQ